MLTRTRATNDYLPGKKPNWYEDQFEIDLPQDKLDNFSQKQSENVQQNITYQQTCKKMQPVLAQRYVLMVKGIQMMLNLESNHQKNTKTREVQQIQPRNIGKNQNTKKIQSIKRKKIKNTNRVQQNQPKKRNTGPTKKSKQTDEMILILQQYQDNDLINKLSNYIKIYYNKIKFNQNNVKSIKQFLGQNHENNQKLGSFTKIFMEVSHLENNGMLHMFNNQGCIKKFLNLIELPEYREKYLEVVKNNLSPVYTKCSNRKLPSLKDIQDVITLNAYKKDLIIILESANVKCIHHLANYLRQSQQTFPTYFKQVLQCKKMILKILKDKSKSVQMQEDFLISMKNNPNRQINEIYEFVTQNMISRNQKSLLDGILKTKSSDYKQQKRVQKRIQKRVQKRTLKNHSTKNKFTSLPLELQVEQEQQVSRMEIENSSQMKTSTEIKDTQYFFQQQQNIPYQYPRPGEFEAQTMNYQHIGIFTQSVQHVYKY